MSLNNRSGVCASTMLAWLLVAMSTMLFMSSTIVSVSCFFFFQAEDGIRDLTVTGVQTCALPICDVAATKLRLHLAKRLEVGAHALEVGVEGAAVGLRLAGALRELARLRAGLREIGRASCRERV